METKDNPRKKSRLRETMQTLLYLDQENRFKFQKARW